MDTFDMDRRAILRAAMATASIGGVTRAASGGCAEQAPSDGGRKAVVYLSRSGNTRVLAGAIARRFDADIFEIRPLDPWPEDYEEMVAWASEWRQRSELMPLAGAVNLRPYTTVFLGFPIWGMALPAPMRSFLRSTDLAQKIIHPFVTHGGYGAGNALTEVCSILAKADVLSPFVLKCDQERATLAALNDWLKQE
ncbi:flavodoxin [Sphingobium yanoikuyae]|uniref:flavodoxin family protein n=1 Tax=Sphingobium yanoikuyae TaxID=13690 RepID=UPI0028AD06E8|nr:flavodoxin [Sphingobium yanoikuyae]